MNLFKNVLSKMFTNHMTLICESKPGFGIKELSMVDMT